MRSGNNDPMAAEIALKSPLPPFALTRLTPMWVKLPAASVREHLNSRVTRKLSLQVLAQASLVSLDNEQVLNDLLARFEFAGAVPPRTSGLVHIVSRAQGLTFLRKPDRTTCGLERYQLSALPPARPAASVVCASRAGHFPGYPPHVAGRVFYRTMGGGCQEKRLGRSVIGSRVGDQMPDRAASAAQARRRKTTTTTEKHRPQTVNCLFFYCFLLALFLRHLRQEVRGPP